MTTTASAGNLNEPTNVKTDSDNVTTSTVDIGNYVADPFSYLEREEFSAEKFKIEVKNLPKYYGITELRKLINTTLKLNSSKVKQPHKNARYVFVCFHNEDEREAAIAAITNHKWKGAILTAMKAKPMADPLLKKRKQGAENNDGKRIKCDLPTDEQLKEQTTPLWRTPYADQLAMKQETMRDILKHLGDQLAKNYLISEWIATQRAKFTGLPCELMDVRFADVIEGYRNKCEFTVGLSAETGKPTVGFRIGRYAAGSVGVGSVDKLLHVPGPMKVAVRLFEKFVQKSTLDVFNPITHAGQFKQLVARYSEKQLMLVVGISPKDLSDTQVEELKKQLVAFFFEDEGKEANVTSLYYQPIMKKKRNDDDCCKPVHLHGDTHLYETLLDLKFRISPEAFFQVNTKCAEILYKSIIDLANIKSTSTVVDVCCGTGTIALCCAGKCDQVLGVEIVPQAIADAKVNAELNNIKNAEFFAGKAEDILYSVVMRARNNDIVAVIDPPRAGLHKQAITSLRKVDKINKMVFVACNPKQSCDNLVAFARPPSKTIQGVPFVPIRAMMVDMFPYTHHAELIVLLERFDVVRDRDMSSQQS